MSRIDVAIVSRDAPLRAEVRPLFGADRYRAFEAATAVDAARLFQASAGAHVVFAVFSATPAADQLQSLLDVSRGTDIVTVCALRARSAAAEARCLFAAGLHEVIQLHQLDSTAVDAVVDASLERERDRRGLLRARERALIGRDVAAAMTVATSARAIRDAFAQGMLALGAAGVACWSRGERGLSLATAWGDPIESGQASDLPFHAAHPAVRAVVDGVTRWYGSAADARDEHAAFRPRADDQALGVLPVRRSTEMMEVVLLAAPAAADDDARHAVEALCSLLGETLRRAQLQAELEEQREAGHRLLSAISHDLADPLNTIAVGTRLLRGGDGGRPTTTFTPIEFAARNALRLVENALTFARSAAGELEMARRDHDVFALLSAVVEEARRRARGGRQLALQVEPTASSATVDAGRIEQAFDNLLTNALTHSPENSTVLVRASSDDYAVYIDVENRSHGIGPDQIHAMLQSMKRLSAASAGGSVGLGLFLVDQIIGAHGGRAWGETFPPDGVRFSVQLPRRPDVRGEELAIVAAGRPRQPEAPSEPLDERLRELAAQFRDPALSRVLEIWWDARSSQRVPHPLDLDRSRLLPYLPDMVSATVNVGTDGKPVFTWASIGPRLERRLRGTLRPNLDAGNEQRNAQYEMYRRCYERQEPTYDYVRQRGSRAYSFERLLLPMTRNQSAGPSDILGIVLFSDPLE